MTLARLVFLLGLGAAACGAPAREGPAPKPAPTAPTADAWSKESWEERHDDMTFTVLPNMARLFQRFGGSADPDMTCRSCHGADAEDVAYRMPHGLPPLDPRHLPSATDPDPKRAKMAKFMRDEVTPTMAELIGVPGLSCFDCHPRQP